MMIVMASWVERTFLLIFEKIETGAFKGFSFNNQFCVIKMKFQFL